MMHKSVIRNPKPPIKLRIAFIKADIERRIFVGKCKKEKEDLEVKPNYIKILMGDEENGIKRI